MEKWRDISIWLHINGMPLALFITMVVALICSWMITCRLLYLIFVSIRWLL